MLTAKLLNAWPQTGLSHHGEEVSRICLELIGAPSEIAVADPTECSCGDFSTSIVLGGTKLVMAEDDILVADGLIRRFRVESKSPNQVQITAVTEHPSKPQEFTVPGDPYVIHLIFPRKPVIQVLSGLRIGIDPGHGGNDHGYKGPVNLLEKDVVLDIAKELRGLLERCGAAPIMTRIHDLDMTAKSRLEVMTAQAADACVEIHVSGDVNPDYQEYRLLVGKSRESQELARYIGAALFERMGIKLRTGDGPADSETHPFPVVRVEPICITHYVDEANFRAPLFRKRIAQSIFNGIHRFFKTKNVPPNDGKRPGGRKS